MHLNSAAGGAAGSDGSVDVKMLAEDNMQLREALKRLHSHSLGEKTEVKKDAMVNRRIEFTRQVLRQVH